MAENSFGISITVATKENRLFILGLLRVSEYSDIRGSEYKIEYEYSSLPKSLDRDLFFFFFFTFFVTETSFSQNGPLKFFTMTTVLIDNISNSNTFVSCWLVTSFIGNQNPQSIPKSADNKFQSIFFKHTHTHTTTTTSVHVLITEPKMSSNVNYQINFKGFVFL